MRGCTPLPSIGVFGLMPVPPIGAYQGQGRAWRRLCEEERDCRPAL